MFLLDTNVLSELVRTAPAPEVAAFVSGQLAERLFTAAICQAEILAGLAVMPEGRWRLDLAAAARAVFQEDFDGRVLPFDGRAAIVYAAIFGDRQRLGRRGAMADLMIASIARSQGFSVVTRNVADFSDCGVAVVDPWAG